MQKDFPEIESTLRVLDTYGDKLFEVNDKKILESHGIYSEPTVFDMLSIKVLSGSAKDALEKSNTIALSESYDFIGFYYMTAFELLSVFLSKVILNREKNKIPLILFVIIGPIISYFGHLIEGKNIALIMVFSLCLQTL